MVILKWACIKTLTYLGFGQNHKTRHNPPYKGDNPLKSIKCVPVKEFGGNRDEHLALSNLSKEAQLNIYFIQITSFVLTYFESSQHRKRLASKCSRLFFFKCNPCFLLYLHAFPLSVHLIYYLFPTGISISWLLS